MASPKLKYIEHPAFAQHTPAQWVEIVERAQAIRAAYTGPRTNIFAHIDSAIAGAQAPVEASIELKFFPRDAIGKVPTKVGHVFQAMFFGRTTKFRTVSMHGDYFMAVGA